MNNIIIFNDDPMLQAIILNPKLLEVIKEQEKANSEFEKKMDKTIKKQKNNG